MQRRAVLGVVVLAVAGAGMLAGCQTEKRKNNPYITEYGKPETLAEAPREVQEFITDSYPDATVEKVFEMRHNGKYAMRHFEIHLVMEGGRKKTVDYNTFGKPTFNAKELDVKEVSGAGTSAGAQSRGITENEHK
ncbi:MAG TPA: hypothetical protein VFE58_12040 [Tepidisphaeraceae bacterium]|jgi:hypothetical protein|nr:hypothetical protein [Tepidisphaeraceae bacterium]